MGPIAEFVMDGTIIGIITALVTWFGLSKRMEKKYQSLIEQKIYETAQKLVHKTVDDRLGRIQKRMMFMSLMCSRVWKHIGIPEDEIESIRRGCEVDEADHKGT